MGVLFIDGQGWALIISSITGFGAMIFAGYVAIRQLPQIHTAVNTNYQRQQAELHAMREEINSLNKAALAKAEAREIPPNTTITAVLPEPTNLSLQIADPTIILKE